MAKHKDLDRISPSITPEDFYNSYVSKRIPVVLKGLPDDAEFRARAWTDLNYLSEKAGSSKVLVEPMHPVAKQFGTDVERISMPFSEFLGSLQKSEGPHHYLTTQYAEQSEDEPTVLPPPMDVLASDYPQVPRLMGNLFLQQVNLWLGKSKDGSTSGLHHDVHDNLYCLLRGRKRFVLYPPNEVANLYPYGTLEKVHENGVISYEGSTIWSDALPTIFGLRTKVAAIEWKIEQLDEVKGKGKGRQNTKERKKLQEALEEAYDHLGQYTLELGEEEEEVDDYDDLMAGFDDGEDDFAGLDADLAEEDSDDEEEEEKVDGDGNAAESKPRPSKQGSSTDATDTSKEPPSFSRIPTALLHQHLNLPTSAVAPAGSTLTDFPLLKKASPPFVVTLNAGEMLYLPASWWHEVTSFSDTQDSDNIHMAFNYWFYPPDNQVSSEFEKPYHDEVVWEYWRARQSGGRGEETSDEDGVGTAKRKNEGKEEGRSNKKSKR